MRFDMHCHTKEGSLDGKILLRDYVLRLKELGYDGMMITDHNSYKAWRHYTRNRKDPAFADFTILKGIEYDTCDAGHILVVMPENVRLPILEMRGLPVRLLIEIVHVFHGILGPAHPAGEKYLSICNSKIYHKHPDILKEFDFMETYNSCISPEANRRAAALAEQYGLPGTGGSDAHRLDCIGLAFTDFAEPVCSESDLIRCLRSRLVTDCGGSHYPETTRDHLGAMYDLLLRLYYLYSKIGNSFRRTRREGEVIYLLSVSDALIRRIQSIDYLSFIPEKIRNSRRWKNIEKQARTQKPSPSPTDNPIR
ncbi:MAG: PHP domain-containing protein [Lachnospiraceae bacterium]|nr:PHP domain-containing protein [Lachnospiraceae bacterium]